MTDVDSVDGGASGDGGQPNQACGTTDALRLEVDGAELPWPWRNAIAGGGTVTVDAGAVHLKVPGGDTGHAVLESRAWHDLSDSAINVVFAEPPGPAQTQLEVRVFGQNTGYFAEVVNGTFRAGRSTGEGISILYEAPFAAEDHMAWQIRERDGVILFETAGQAGAWVTRAMSIGAPVAPVFVTLELDGESTVTEDSAAIIESINADRTGSYCSVSTVFDSFDDGAPGPAWAPWDYNGCVWLEENGALRFQNFTPSYSDCGYRSRRLFDLSNSSVQALIFESGAGAGQANFGIIISDVERYQFRVGSEATEMATIYHIDGSGEDIEQVPFEYATHKYWRFRHDGQLLFEVSGDRDSWTSIRSVAEDRVEAVQLIVYGSGNGPGPGEAGFEQIGQ